MPRDGPRLGSNQQWLMVTLDTSPPPYIGWGIAGNLPHKEVNKDIRSGGTGLAAGTTCAETRKKTDQVICVHLAAIIRDQGYNRLTFLPLFRNIAPPCSMFMMGARVYTRRVNRETAAAAWVRLSP